MKIKSATVNALTSIICGEQVKGKQISPYRSGSNLVRFFNEFGTEDQYYISGFPARKTYTENKIRQFNGTSTLRKIIEESVASVHYFDTDYSSQTVADYLNEYLSGDGFELVADATKQEESFIVRSIDPSSECFNRESLDKLSHNFILEQIKKSNNKINDGDYDGAITNARSLVEAIFEKLIVKLTNSTPENFNGDLMKMYKVLKKELRLDPSNNDLEKVLKQVLSGLNSVLDGLSGISNKLSDRHSRKYVVKKHHAKLAVNCALTLGEFVLDTYDFQKIRLSAMNEA